MRSLVFLRKQCHWRLLLYIPNFVFILFLLHLPVTNVNDNTQNKKDLLELSTFLSIFIFFLHYKHMTVYASASFSKIPNFKLRKVLTLDLVGLSKICKLKDSCKEYIGYRSLYRIYYNINLLPIWSKATKTFLVTTLLNILLLTDF